MFASRVSVQVAVGHMSLSDVTIKLDTHDCRRNARLVHNVLPTDSCHIQVAVGHRGLSDVTVKLATHDERIRVAT